MHSSSLHILANVGAMVGRAGSCWPHVGICSVNGRGSGPYVGQIGRMLGLCWGHFGPLFTPCWPIYCTSPDESCPKIGLKNIETNRGLGRKMISSGTSGNHVGASGLHVGDEWAPSLPHLGICSASVWGPSGPMLGLCWSHLTLVLTNLRNSV